MQLPHHSSALRVARAFSSGIATVLLLAGCQNAPPPVRTMVGDVAGVLTMTPCLHRDSIPAECGTLTVPERRDLPHARLVSIPVTRIRATGASSREPIFFLSGGPGASNMRFRPPAWTRRDHDVVLVGYRGVDGSERLECPEMTAAIRRKTGDLLNAASLTLRRAALHQCAERLRREGLDLHGFTMDAVVEDLDAVRNALGYERLNLYSVSYGTRLAQLYAGAHRNRVHRSVMVGVNPPGRFVWEADQLDTILIQEFGRLCAQDAWCRARTPDLAATVRRVAHNMPTGWGPLSIDRGVVLSATFGMLYDRGTAAIALDAIVDADRGDASGLALLSRFARPALSTGVVFGDLFAKGSTDFDAQRDYTTAFDPPGTVMGSPISSLFWAQVSDSIGWPIVRTANYSAVADPSDVETLLIGGNLDVSTPSVNATRELLPKLEHGHQVIFRDAGHANLMEFQGDAYGRLVGGFFAGGAVDTSGFHYDPMRFRVKWKLSRLVKLSVVGAVVVLSGLVFAGIKLGQG